jgi:quercetin dioxygenase-like cupin family protein
MPYSGQILEDKETGNLYEFLETGADTVGERVTIKITVKKPGKFVPDHIHLLQNETFKVIDGILTCYVKGEKKLVQKGEHMILNKGVPHNHFSESNEQVEYIQTVEPAFDIDYFIENYIGLINDGKIKGGDPSFMQKMVTLKYLDSPTLLASVPVGLQKILVNVFGPLARFLGYRALYEKYTGLEK